MLRVTLVVSASLLLFAGAATGAPQYLGVKKCKKCHLKQFKSWKKTKKSKTFELLAAGTAAEAKKKAGLDPAKDYTKDKTCLPCHTTGYGKPGGYGKSKVDKYLQGVTCEACHGPGGDFVRDDRMSNKNKKFKSADLKKQGLIVKTPEKVCKTCHNKKSPFYQPFDYAKRLKNEKGLHKRFPQKHAH